MKVKRTRVDEPVSDLEAAYAAAEDRAEHERKAEQERIAEKMQHEEEQAKVDAAMEKQRQETAKYIAGLAHP